MAGDRFAARRQKLLQKLKESGVDVLLVTNFVNVSYLTGFSGDDSYLVVGKSLCVLISDSRYEEQLQAECPGLDVTIRPATQSITNATVQLVQQSKLAKIGFESSSMTYDQAEHLRSELKSAELVPLAGLVEDLRMIKDADEIAETRAAVRFAEKGFACLRASLRGDQTELEVAHDLEHAMRRFGSPRAAFRPIVAAGPRAALPHATPTTALVGDSDILLVDWGADSGRGYKSDLTRVLVTGKLSARFEKVYRVVLEAQLAGIAAIRPGAIGSEVDAAARDVIKKAGFGKQFGHSLGHGLGLYIHELPRLSATSDMELKPGMIVTVEPGIYIPGLGGVRIEDDILVTKDGAEVLTSVPKELSEMVVS